jgi:hypothetical protein
MNWRDIKVNTYLSSSARILLRFLLHLRSRSRGSRRFLEKPRQLLLVEPMPHDLLPVQVQYSIGYRGKRSAKLSLRFVVEGEGRTGCDTCKGDAISSFRGRACSRRYVGCCRAPGRRGSIGRRRRSVRAGSRRTAKGDWTEPLL